MHYSEQRRVAVIGAGISGVCAAAHLLKHGLSVTVLERCGVAGGIWHFDERSAHESLYPNNQPSKGDYIRYDPAESSYITPPRTPDSEFGRSSNRHTKLIPVDGKNARISHAPPGPCYASLKNNVPLTLMKTSLLPWPTGLEEFVGQKHSEQYIQQISKAYGVEQATEYNTRVENVVKVGTVWKVTTSVLYLDSAGNSEVSLQTRDFDAVVVASGHYHMPRVPDIPGLREWKEKYPTQVRHSKTYRSADGFENQKILLIGSGISSIDIAKDLASKITETYQSSRGGTLDLPTTYLPDNALRIGPVKSFKLDNKLKPQSAQSQEDTIPGTVTLQNGSKLCGIHQVILATGYITSYPFMPQYHSDTHPRTSADNDLLVTSEGDMVHNLHKDIFYIEDPTLAFVGVPYHIATFSLYDFQAQIVARVLAGVIDLPSRPIMRAEYKARVTAKGLGMGFHSLRGMGDEVEYVRQLVEWVNREPIRIGGSLMNGHTEEWLRAYHEHKEKIKFLRGNRTGDADAARYDHVVLPDSVTCQ